MMKRIFVYALPALLFVGCQTKNVTEAERFDSSVRKELPFAVDSLRWLDGVDLATYQFACKDYVATPPDAFIGLDGALNVYNNFLFEAPTRQTEDVVWRNVLVSRNNQRIICIDRYLSEGRTKGFVYVLQTETKRFPTLGLYHWDVSDSHNIEMAGGTLEHLRKLTLKRMKGDGRYTAPASQNDYWALDYLSHRIKMEQDFYEEPSAEIRYAV